MPRKIIRQLSTNQTKIIASEFSPLPLEVALQSQQPCSIILREILGKTTYLGALFENKMNYRILLGFFTSLLVYVGFPDGAGVSFTVLLYLPMALVNFSADYPFGFAAISMASHAMAILVASLKPATYPGVILIPHVFASLMLLLLSHSKFPTLLTASFSLSFTVWGVFKREKPSTLPP